MNAGKYNKKIGIWTSRIETETGYQQRVPLALVMTAFADVKTTRGMTLIAAGSDFEKAYTNFTIRRPKAEITRRHLVRYQSKTYSIEYINNINEEGVELELQCKEITH